MKDNNNDYTKLICSILDISPSRISDLNVISDNQQTSIYLKLKKNSGLYCPYCSSTNYLSNGFYRRHVIIDNDFIINEKLYIDVRRYRCCQCSKSFSDKASIVPDNKKLSYKMIFRIMELLKSPKITFKEVSNLTGVSVQTITRVFDAHTHIPRKPFPEAICIDEVYTKVNSYKNSKYSCIFYDFYNHQILDVTPCRRKNYLSYYLDRIPIAERDNVKFVSIDMYAPYKDIVYRYFKKAVICVDSFHVIQHLINDLNSLRIRLMNQYDSTDNEYYLLNRFKFLLLNNNIDLDKPGKYNSKLGMVISYRDLLERMLSISPQLEEGYRLKQQYIKFNSTADYQTAEQQLDGIIDEFIKADIAEFGEFITLQKNWRKEIINSFLQYRTRRMNSSVAESINQIVANLLYNTKGIRNNERRRKRILYAVNKDGFTIK